jgi:hypothetical protein
MRRNINDFTDILAHVATTGAGVDSWRYLITAGDIGRDPERDLRATTRWVEGFRTPELAMAAADQVLLESGRAILAPEGTDVLYMPPRF